MNDMPYRRVIPRDFFNESKLLKCMGLLALKIHECQLPEGLNITIEETGEPFEIRLDNAGYVYVANYRTAINGQPVKFLNTYNSKNPYPLVCRIGYDEYPVFEDDGEFSDEFKSIEI